MYVIYIILKVTSHHSYILSFLFQSKCIELFDHLCGLVDNSATMVEQHERDLIYVAKQLILDGK